MGWTFVAFLAGFLVATLIWWLAGRAERRQRLAGDGTTVTVGGNELERGDAVLVGDDVRHVLLKDEVRGNVTLTGAAVGRSLVLLSMRGLLHAQPRDGQRMADGLTFKVLHERHPAEACITLRAGDKLARLWLFRNGDVELSLHPLVSTDLDGSPHHVGYLDIAENPNPFNVPGFESQAIGASQPEYRTLHAVRGPAPECAAISRWKLTDQQQAAVRAGKDIWLEQWTFGHPLQPVRLSVGVPEELQGDGVPAAAVVGPDPRD
jgi:hypothetical protein